MVNSPLLLVFESYSPALAEIYCLQFSSPQWATKPYCRHVMANAKEKKDEALRMGAHLIFQALLFYILLEVQVLILRQLF